MESAAPCETTSLYQGNVPKTGLATSTELLITNITNVEVLAHHFRNPTDDGCKRKPFQDIAISVFRGRSY